MPVEGTDDGPHAGSPSTGAHRLTPGTAGQPVSTDPLVEEWTLDHPRMGLFKAYVATVEQLRGIDPDFPSQANILTAESGKSEAPSADDAADHRDVREGCTDTDDEAAAEKVAELIAKGQRITQRLEKRLGPDRTEKLRSWSHRDAWWRPRGLLITRDGVPLVRQGSLSSTRTRLVRSLPPGRLTSSSSVNSGPRIAIEVAAPGRFVTAIRIHDEAQVATFDAPVGSPGQQRQQAMDASPWKRVAYPLASGLGRAGWALWILLIGPVIGKLLAPVIDFIAWLLAPIVRWIGDHWPHIPWPTIDLPDIPWPRIPWPDVDLPHIPWPDWSPPHWVVWMLDHPKTWTPVVLAIFFAVMAVRNNAKSRETKAAWEAERRTQADAARRDELARLAAAMRHVVATGAAEERNPR